MIIHERRSRNLIGNKDKEIKIKSRKKVVSRANEVIYLD